MTKIRVGVLRGGPSSEYEVSLKTGAAVLTALDRERYEPIDIFISKDGAWHIQGVEMEPHKAFRKADIVFNALHGYYGEDGKLQQLLETHGMPFTGSGSFASAMAMNKHLSKEAFIRAGLRVPKHILVEGAMDPSLVYHQALLKFAPPYVVKPVSGGSSFGVALVKSREEFDAALAAAFEAGNSVLVEEYIPGVEATVGIIQGFRGKDPYALPPVEIRPKSGIFDYNSKYAGGAREIVPATFSPSIKAELERLAIAAHEALGLRHYSRSDFIVTPRRGVYIFETNSLPGLTDESLVPKALAAVGSSLAEFVNHLVGLAVSR